MTTMREGNITCSFDDTWSMTKYDDWAFYKNQFRDCCCGNKAVDFLGYNPADKTLWLIELKDYRQFRRTKDDKISLWDEVAIKVRDSLAGIFAAKVYDAHPEHSYAKAALKAINFRIVLHLEQPVTHSKLFPRPYDPANIQQQLKRIVKPIDAHPTVVEINNMRDVPWTAQ